MTPKKQYLNSVTPAKQYGTPALSAVNYPKSQGPIQTTFSPSATSGGYKATPVPTPSPAMKQFGSTKQIAGPTESPVLQTKRPTATPQTATGMTGSTLPPAGQSYVQSQLNDIKNQALGVQDKLNAGVSEPQKKEESAYLKYLRTMFNPDEAKIAQDNLNALNQRTADELARTREEEARLRENAMGQLEGGQKARLGEEARKSNASLADLAIAKGYSTDILKQYTDAGASLYEAEEAARLESEKPISLEEATKLGLPFGTTFADARKAGKIPTETGAATYAGAGADPIVDAYIKNVQNGTMKIGDVPKEYMSAVSMGLGTQPKPQSQISQQATSVIDELLANPKLDNIFGPVDQFIGGVFGEAATAKNKYNQLKGLLSLENIKYLKGTGAISDAEQRLLANASTALARNLNETEARKILTDLRAELQVLQNSDSGAGEDVVLPDGTVINTNW